MENFRSKYSLIILLLISLMVSIALSSCSFLEDLETILNDVEGDFTEEGTSGEVNNSRVQRDLVVHFIDVGQGDSILIQLPSNGNMLIDAGDNDKGQVVVDYLKKQGVNRIDYLVATHPHADHIGGMDDVIDELDIGDIYMPRVEHTTKTYMDVLEAIDRKGLKIKIAKEGVAIPIEGVSAKILAPNEELKSDNLNDYSVVIRLTYGQTAFLFQGDAEKRTEESILESDSNIKADVIKLGHHGSTTSNSPDYIEAVEPDYAVIMLGEGNKYGHPHKEILALMDEKGIIVYRTDKDGNIVAVSDGKKISFNR